MRLKIRYLHQRTAEDDEQIDLEPEQLTLRTQETANSATSSRRLVAVTFRKARDADSESFRTSIIRQNGGEVDNSTVPMNLLWMETALLHFAEKTQNKKFSKVRDKQQFSPIMSRLDQ